MSVSKEIEILGSNQCTIYSIFLNKYSVEWNFNDDDGGI